MDWLVVFLEYFFTRTSIMLFVLRLLPPAKKIEQRVILVCMVLNFAITVIALVSYGVRCIPFRAVYAHVEGARCISDEVLVATQYTNGGMMTTDLGVKTRAVAS